MSKIRLALVAAAAVMLPAAAAFAAHAATCCGDPWCCLQHLGCCF